MEMNAKSRKLVLHCMRINYAVDNLKIKFTKSKIVNLEMFTNVRIQNFQNYSHTLNILIKKQVEISYKFLKTNTIADNFP